MDSPAPDPSGAKTNGLVNGEQHLQDESEEAQDTEHQDAAPSEPEAGTPNHTINGTRSSGAVVAKSNADVSLSDGPITPKGRGAENRGKLSRSASRKSVVEMLPDDDAPQENNIADSDADGDAVMQT
jgi:histone acetyltransferase SAS3